jgi:RND superfamily putative drug exporter
VLERWTRAVLRFRVAVLACWLAVVVLGALAAAGLPPLLSNSFAVPGSESDRAREILAAHFGERPDGVFTVVFTTPRARDKAEQARLQRRLGRAARTVPTGKAGEVHDGAGVVYGDVSTTLDLQHAKRWTEPLRRALRGTPRAYVTGQPAIQHDLDPILAADLRRGEAVALPIALLVLIGVLGFSLAVLVPFVFAACTITATLAIVWSLAHGVLMVSYVANLVELIGLGLAVDYSLLVVARFREELEGEGSVDDAVVRTISTAGRAVVFSGAAVAIGLALIVLMPVPFVRSLGVGGFLVPVASIAAALTLQPVLLSLLGRRGMRRIDLLPGTRGFWERLAGSIMRRPVAYLAAGTALLVAAAVPVAWLQLTPGSISAIPQSTESARGLALLRDDVGPGVITLRGPRAAPPSAPPSTGSRTRCSTTPRSSSPPAASGSRSSTRAAATRASTRSAGTSTASPSRADSCSGSAGRSSRPRASPRARAPTRAARRRRASTSSPAPTAPSRG